MSIISSFSALLLMVALVAAPLPVLYARSFASHITRTALGLIPTFVLWLFVVYLNIPAGLVGPMMSFLWVIIPSAIRLNTLLKEQDGKGTED